MSTPRMTLPQRGRPVAIDPKDRTISVRLTEQQYRQWVRLGGAKWLHKMISLHGV